MYMLKCLISLNSCVVRDVVCKPNSTVPMSFATKESASNYAVENVLNKPFANISNANKVFGFQPVPYNAKPNFELVA
jgi:hypothetical protein